jgi:hypothetical protein
MIQIVNLMKINTQFWTHDLDNTGLCQKINELYFWQDFKCRTYLERLELQIHSNCLHKFLQVRGCIEALDQKQLQSTDKQMQSKYI